MATVNSLVCWGGLTGKTVTLTIASPCVVTSTNHGLRDGTRLVFSTTGALPTGITAGTTYYAKSTAANTFNLYTDAALTSIVNTSGTQSGTHTAKSVLMGEYFAQHPGRWGAAGSERCYDGIASAIAALNGILTIGDKAVVEFGEAFSEATTYGKVISLVSASGLFTSSIDGVRTEAFHYGVVGAGYQLVDTGGWSSGGFFLSGIHTTVDGLTACISTATGNSILWRLSGVDNTLINCISYSTVSPPSTAGFHIEQGVVLGRIINCLATGLSGASSVGFRFNGYGANTSFFAHNSAHKNTTGFLLQNINTAQSGWYYYNVSVGNTTNWSAFDATNYKAAAGNCGSSGDTPWYKTTDTGIKTLTTADFADWANNDFRPASATSPHVELFERAFDMVAYDLADAVRPNYNNGAAEYYDAGCYEYDHGFGPHPASTTVTFSGVVAGSEIHVYDSEDNELAGTESCTANQALTWGIPTNPNVKITIIKRGLRWMKFTYLSEEGPQMIPIFPQPDLGYNNPA